GLAKHKNQTHNSDRSTLARLGAESPLPSYRDYLYDPFSNIVINVNLPGTRAAEPAIPRIVDRVLFAGRREGAGKGSGPSISKLLTTVATSGHHSRRFAPHYGYYKFIKFNSTIRCTPAIAAGICDAA